MVVSEAHGMDFARQGIEDEVVFSRKGLLIESAAGEFSPTPDSTERVRQFCRAATASAGPDRPPQPLSPQVALRLGLPRGCAVRKS